MAAATPASPTHCPIRSPAGEIITATADFNVSSTSSFSSPFVVGGTQTLGDAGFEAPAQGTGKYQYDPTGTIWTYTSSAGVAANGSAFTNHNPNAPQGTQVSLPARYGLHHADHRAGRRQLPDQLRGGAAERQPPEPQYPGRRQQRGHLHADGIELRPLQHRHDQPEPRPSHHHASRGWTVLGATIPPSSTP